MLFKSTRANLLLRLIRAEIRSLRKISQAYTDAADRNFDRSVDVSAAASRLESYLRESIDKLRASTNNTITKLSVEAVSLGAKSSDVRAKADALDQALQFFTKE